MYAKTDWKARKGLDLTRFLKFKETAGSVILQNDPTAVTEPGTDFSPANMNKIERGIFDAHNLIDEEKRERISADTALNARVNLMIPSGEKGAANGVATLGGDGIVPFAQLPPLGGGTNLVLPRNGFFGMYVNENEELKVTTLRVMPNGDLVVTAAAGEPNLFRYDSETGNLYYRMEENT